MKTRLPPPPPSRTSAALPLSRQRRLAQLVCTGDHEAQLRRAGCTRIAGVDEVGRGCLFGPVVAAAVILPPDLGPLRRLGLTDSKKLTAPHREQLDQAIRGCALAVALAQVDAATIDRINIYQASRLAMRLAVEQLSPPPDHLLIDALRIDHSCPQTPLTFGDSLSLSIAAASVLAKVHRDALLRELDLQYPGYSLAANKGYGTAAHRAALRQLGPTRLHRLTFAPVALCQPPASHPEVRSGSLFSSLPDDPDAPHAPEDLPCP